MNQLQPFLPGEHDLLLLEALLGPSESARAACGQWLEQVYPAGIDEGIRRLLPLLYHRMNTWRMDHPTRSQLAAIYRHYWLLTAQLHARKDRVIAMLAHLDMPLVLLKGLALGPTVYPEIATRPAADIDLLVPPARFDEVVGFLEGEGFRHKQIIWHAIALTRDDVPELDLHRSPYHETYKQASVAPLFQRLLPMPSHPAKVFMLGQEDQLLHAVSHGLRMNVVSPLRWVVDATLLLRSSAGSFDWRLFLNEAERLDHQEAARLGLEIIGRLDGVLVPATIQRQLASRRSGKAGKKFMEQRSIFSPIAIWRRLRLNYDFMRALLMYFKLICHSFDLSRPLHLPRRALFWAMYYVKLSLRGRS